LQLAVKHDYGAVAIGTIPSIKEAAHAAQVIISHGVPLAVSEVMYNVQMQCINQAGSTKQE
jgi:hypothetical protein